MNGAESLVATLKACGVEVCFANPGTSEMHFVAALDKAESLRCVLTLFEGVATGAADGYARMADKPAATLLHLGPGLANGLANLHNARRAGVPVINVVGDHATSHLRYDAPLTSDVVGFARPVSAWVHRTTSADTLASDAARAFQAASAAPGQIATLIVPADAAWSEAERPAHPPNKVPIENVEAAAIESVAQALQNGGRSALLIRGPALQRRGLLAAARIAEATGARLLCDTFAPRLDRGAGLPAVERIPYFGEHIAEFLADVQQLVLVCARPPVSFFAYPDKPSWPLSPDCKVRRLAHEHEDGVDALERLAQALGAPARPNTTALARPQRPTGKFNPFSIGQAIGALLPEDTVLCDDSATSTGGVLAGTANAPAHTHMALTGGAIGSGLPLALGAAIAAPHRKTICLTGDGSAMYTIQTLWTIAREKLDVTVIVFANRSYRILNVELGRVGAGPGGAIAQSMLDLRNPDLDFVRLAEGMGVEASRVDNIESFYDQFGGAMAKPGPRLIEAII